MDEKKSTPLASEMYTDLKESNQFLRKLLVGACVIILALVVALAGTNLYHIYQWSQFDTIVVDTGEGGNAIFSEGDNTGGIYHGEDNSTPEEVRDLQGQAD